MTGLGRGEGRRVAVSVIAGRVSTEKVGCSIVVNIHCELLPGPRGRRAGTMPTRRTECASSDPEQHLWR